MEKRQRKEERRAFLRNLKRIRSHGHCRKVEYNLIGMLLLLLSSVIYHSEWIQRVVMENPGHPFGLIPLFSDNELLARLKEKVCICFFLTIFLFNYISNHCISGNR